MNLFKYHLRKSAKRIALFAGVALWMGVANIAAAQPVDRLAAPLDCSVNLPEGLQGCVLRIPAGYVANSIEARKISDGSLVSDDWELLSASDVDDTPRAELSGTLLLIDISRGGPGRRAIFDRNEKEAIKTLIAAMPEQEQISLVTFGAERKDLVAFTRDRQAILSAIDTLELTETNTLLQRSLLESIRLMAAQTSIAIGRVVIVSDGLDEEGQNPQDVIALAKEKGVSISALASFWQGSGNPDIGRGLGFLRAIVEATQGELAAAEYRKADEAKQSIDDLARRLALARTSSRLVTLKDKSNPVATTLTVNVERPVVAGSTQREEVEFKEKFVPLDANGKPLPEKAAPAPKQTETPKAPVPKPAVVSPWQARADAAIGFAKTYWYLFAALAALLMVGILALILRNRKPGSDELDLDDIGDPSDVVSLQEPIAPPAQPILGVLVEKTTGQRIKVTSGRVSIGRGTKNDIVLSHNSISRAHAILQIESNGFMAVTDLQSLNGTFVNGNRVSETQQLRFGDAIKLGEFQVILQQA